MELGETPSGTAVRETKKETGVEVKPVDLLGVYTIHNHICPNDDIVHSIDVVFVAEAMGGIQTPDGIETTDVGYFSLDDLPSPIFTPTSQFLAIW